MCTSFRLANHLLQGNLTISLGPYTIFSGELAFMHEHGPGDTFCMLFDYHNGPLKMATTMLVELIAAATEAGFTEAGFQPKVCITLNDS